MTADTLPKIQITNAKLERAVAHSRDRAKFGPRVACELYWANHATYGAAWTRQSLLDVKRCRARELREAGYWECFLDRSGMDCGILLYARGERLAKAISHILGLDYCLPGEGWLNDDAWARSYEIGWGEVLRYRLAGLLRCRRLRMRIASGVRRVLRRKPSALESAGWTDVGQDEWPAAMADVVRVVQDEDDEQ